MQPIPGPHASMTSSDRATVVDQDGRARSNRIGVLAMTACFAVFMVNDGLVKHASESLPSGQTIFLRGCFSMMLILVVAAVLGQWRTWARIHRPIVYWRAALDGIGSVTYLTALFHMPIGNATAINSTAPLMLTAAAAWWFAEPVGPRRWSAIAIGFLGILLVVQPASEGFNAWALLALAATAINVGRDLLTRRIDPATPALLVTFVGAAGVTVAAGIMTPFDGWETPRPETLLQLLIAAVFLSLGYFLLVIAMRHGEISLVSAFRYSAIPMALLLGWLRWGDVPDTLAWIGIALVIGSGLYILHRERVRRSHRS
jgi:drug/metabolite transporter (DMT)-like permease